MTTTEAFRYLKRFRPAHSVKRYYGSNDLFALACKLAFPTFEYPDWDWRPIGELIRHAERCATARDKTA